MTISRALVDRALSAASDTRQLTLDVGALASVVAAYTSQFGQRPAVVIADPTTWMVAGREVDAQLRRVGLAARAPIVLAAPVYADFERVLELEAALQATEAVPVAVGSGTINDLTKLAASRLGWPYLVVATAASMDGYAAFGASITRDGFKQTIACPAPAAIAADLTVLAAAPTSLTAAGYGDLIGKIPAGADWLLADALEIEPIDPVAWSLVQDPLRTALSAPERLRQHDTAATAQFFLGLVLSGLAMQATQTSRPASGAEHLISHLWEMTGLTHAGASPSHGTKVGIGTVLVTMLYEELLRLDLTRVDIDARVAALPAANAVERSVRTALPAGELAERAVAESLAKHPAPGELRNRLTLLRERWPALRERLRAQLMPAIELRQMLRGIGSPADPAELGVSATRLRADLLSARLIRRRYTILDLAAEVGLLEPCIERVVAALQIAEPADTPVTQVASIGDGAERRQ